LLHRLADIPGMFACVTRPAPRDVEESLIAAHRDCRPLMPFVYLPCSPLRPDSCRDEPQTYRRRLSRIIDRFRAVRQDIAFHRILSLGFPGETRRFRCTLRWSGKSATWRLFVHSISPRPETPAADMRETVSAGEMDERLVRLQGLIDSQHRPFNAATIGNTVESVRTRSPQSRPDRRPHRLSAAGACDGPQWTSSDQVLPVAIESLERYSLLGELADLPHARLATCFFSMNSSSQRRREPEPLPKSASDSSSLAPSRNSTATCKSRLKHRS